MKLRISILVIGIFVISTGQTQDISPTIIEALATATSSAEARVNDVSLLDFQDEATTLWAKDLVELVLHQETDSTVVQGLEKAIVSGQQIDHSLSLFARLILSETLEKIGKLEEVSKHLPLLQSIKEIKTLEYLKGQVFELEFRYYGAIGEYQKSDLALDKSIETFEKSKRYRNLCLALTNKANITMDTDPESALLHIDQSLEIANEKNLLKEVGYSYTTKSSILKTLGDYHGGIECLYKGLSIAEKLEDQFEISLSLLLLAAAQIDQSQDSLGLSNIKNARRISQQNDLVENEITSYYYESYIYVNKKDHRASIQVCTKGLELAEEAQSMDDIALLSMQIAESYSRLGLLDSAFLFVQNMERANIRQDVGYTVRGQAILSDYYLSKGEIQKAKAIATDGIEFGESASLPDIVCEGHNRMYLITKQQGNFQEALKHLEIATDLSAQLVSEGHATAIGIARISNDFAKEKELIELKNQQEKIKLEAKQQRTILLSTIAFIGLGAMLIFYLLLRKKNNFIETQNETLQDLNQTKDQLIQIIGHDLRKPSIAFKGIAENIRYLIQKQDYERLLKLGNEIEGEASQMYNLTDNLLKWAVTKKNVITISKHEVDIKNLVDECVALFKVVADRKSVSLVTNIDQPISIDSDRNSLLTIIRNLVDNAIKFTPQEGKVLVNHTLSKDSLMINIQDGGSQMTQVDLDNLLLNNSPKSTKGTSQEKGNGIGLTIVKSLVSKIGGQIKATTLDGQGSQFSIILPR